MSSIKLVPKISAADLMGNVSKFVRENILVGEKAKAYGVAGICDSIETGTHTYGDWVRYCGSFEAINYHTGEVFRSEKAHVPDVLCNVLQRDLESLKSGEVKELKHSTTHFLSTNVEFAFIVEIERLEDDANGAIKYKYVTSPKTEIAKNDKIAHLSALLLPEPEAEKPKLAKPKTK